MYNNYQGQSTTPVSSSINFSCLILLVNIDLFYVDIKMRRIFLNITGLQERIANNYEKDISIKQG